MSSDAAAALHEDIRRTHRIKESSDKSFGLVFTVVFTIIGLAPLISAGSPRYWSLAVAGITLLLSLLRPTTLRPLNRLWLRFGRLLHRIVSPLILFLMYCVAIVPMGLLLRLLRKDLLLLRWSPGASTYWIRRESEPGDMRNQF